MLKRIPERLRACAASSVCILGAVLGPSLVHATPTDVVNTVHNLSVSGTGTVRALTETRICVFCHTPHNATPLSPLWNKELQPRVYTVYTSPTLVAGQLPQPSGSTKLCLSCHDGTIAMGAVVNPAGGIAMASGDNLPALSLSNFGLDLSGHHPVSFSYQASLPNPELYPSPPPELTYGGFDEIHCTTCHDPHNDVNGKFLAKDNRYSALCRSCHQVEGWLESAHANSTASVVGVLPRPPKTWPDYTQLNEWGCEACHTPHFAPTAQELLIFTTLGAEPFSCTSAGCHSSEPAPAHLTAGARSAMPIGTSTIGSGGMVNIGAQTKKPSAHHEIPGLPMTAQRTPGGVSSFGIQGVTCVDCHNPHVTADASSAPEPPFASAALRGVNGVDRNGITVEEAQYEYEVCLKCHGDYAAGFPYIVRVVNDTNSRREFDPGNASYHPVIGIGRNPNVPSIPSSLAPGLTVSSMIYCTSCHSDDEGGSRGPHGSTFPPILREKYETADNTPENYDNYALCYRCHDRNSILRDVSFERKTQPTNPTGTGGGHSGHLSDGAPCSACHDAHGVSDLAPTNTPATGAHTDLINFDTRIVSPLPGTDYPTFCDCSTTAPKIETCVELCMTNPMISGSCNLLCHNVTHENWSYP